MISRAARRREEHERNRLNASRARLLKVLSDPKALDKARVIRTYGKVACPKPFGEAHYLIGEWYLVVFWSDGVLDRVKWPIESLRWRDWLEVPDIAIRRDTQLWDALSNALRRINMR